MRPIKCLAIDDEPMAQSIHSTETHLLVKEGYKYVNVQVDEICYIKGMNEYVQLCFVDRKPVVAHISMQQIKEKLPAHFLQVHRSYIVNMLRIKEIERLRILMADNTRIAVSESFKPAFMNYLRLHALTKNDRDIDTDKTADAFSGSCPRNP